METTDAAIDDWEDAGKRGDVKAAFRAALDMLAGHVRYRLCDRRVGMLTVTWNDAGQPFLDGKPLHRMTA